MAIQMLRRQFTAAEFELMLETGILREDERVELLDGEICEMSPVGSRHAACVKRLNALLLRHLEATFIVGVQDPIRLGDLSEPQPDLAILRARDDFYADAHPQPEDVVLLIEVAETSLEYDRDVKLPRYAQAGIPEVWIVDVNGEVVLQYSQPEEKRYALASAARAGDAVSPAGIASLNIAVADILA